MEKETSSQNHIKFKEYVVPVSNLIAVGGTLVTIIGGLLAIFVSSIFHNLEQQNEYLRHINSEIGENIRSLLQRSAEETRAFREEMKVLHGKFSERGGCLSSPKNQDNDPVR